MSRIFFLILVACASVALAAPANAASEGFDNSQGDWQKATILSVLEYRPQGGNPGGYLLFHGPDKTGISTANPAFTGDYAAAGYDEITVDINVQLLQMTAFRPEVFIRASASVAGWSYRLNALTLQGGVWQHLEVPMNAKWSDAEAVAAGWKMDSGTPISFADTMRSVWHMGIFLRYPPITAAFLGVDNIVVHKKPVPVGERLQQQNTKTMERSVTPVKPLMRRP